MRAVVPIVVAGVLLAAAPAAQAAVTATAGDGTANADGSATVPVTVTCPAGARVVEAHLTLTQDDQSIYGMRGISDVRCTGRPRTHLVTIRPFDGAYHPGEAFASPYVLVDPRRGDEWESGGDFNVITLR